MLRFGQDGWSAVISDEFTFDNVRQAAAAAAACLIDKGWAGKPLIVGYDARFLSEKFAEAAVKEFKAAGLSILLTERDAPLPVLAWAVKDRDAAGAFVISGGVKPHQFSGIKLLPFSLEVNDYLSGGKSAHVKKAAKSQIERFEPRERYFKFAEASIDYEAIKKAGLKVVVDPMCGSVRGYFDPLLQRLGCQVEEIHNYRDVLFGGLAPDPREENLAELKNRMSETKTDLGFAFSGDGAAFAIIDAPGNYKYHGETKDALVECLQLLEMTAQEKL